MSGDFIRKDFSTAHYKSAFEVHLAGIRAFDDRTMEYGALAMIRRNLLSRARYVPSLMLFP